MSVTKASDLFEPSAPQPFLISAAQGKRLYAIARQAGWCNEEIRDYLREHYDIGHTKDILRKDYEVICMAMSKAPPVEAVVAHKVPHEQQDDLPM